MNDKTAGRLLILVAAVMWSTSGLFAKVPLFADWPLQVAGLPVRGPLLAFWRAVFASLVLLPFVRQPCWTWKLAPMVLMYAVMNYTFLAALTLTTEANAIWLQHTAPAWIFLIGVFAFHEPVHPRDGWLLGCCLAGVGLILSFELGGQAPLGIVLGLLGGVTYAGVVLSLRHLRDEDGGVAGVSEQPDDGRSVPAVGAAARDLAHGQADAGLVRLWRLSDGTALFAVCAWRAPRDGPRGRGHCAVGADPGARVGLRRLAARAFVPGSAMVDAGGRRADPAGLGSAVPWPQAHAWSAAKLVRRPSRSESLLSSCAV